MALLFSLVLARAATPADIDGMITKMTGGYAEEQVKDMFPANDGNWGNDFREVICLVAMGKTADADYAFMLPELDPAKLTTAQQYASAIISLTLLGKNPGDCKTLADKLAALQNADGVFGDALLTFDHAIQMLAFRMVAANKDAGYYQPAAYNEAKTLAKLISLQASDNGFGFVAEDDPMSWGSDVDSTGLAMVVLSLFDTAEAKAALAKAVSYLAEQTINDDGQIEFEDEWDGYPYTWTSANSQAWAIIGLLAAGEDLNAEKWMKNGKTLADGLLKFEEDLNEQGFFQYNIYIDESNSITDPDLMSMRDVMHALYCLKLGKCALKELAVKAEEPPPVSSEQISSKAVSSQESGDTSPPTGTPYIPFVILLAAAAAVCAVTVMKRGKVY